MSTNETLNLLEEMAIFARVVDAGSFSAAARQLGATPSAISRGVSRLEKALNTRLLHRTTRKLRLTESGTQVYQHCVEIVNSAQAVVSASGQFSDTPQGTVRVSVPKALGYSEFHPLMFPFLELYPKVDVVLRLDDRNIDFIDEQIDIVIRITDKPPLGMMGKPLFPLHHIICATPDYLVKHDIPREPQDLIGHSCLYLGEEPNDAKWKFYKEGKVVSVNVTGRYAANHTGVRLDAIKAGVGIGSLPYFSARTSLASGEIVQILPEWTFKTHYSGEVWLLYPPTRYLPPHVSALVEYLTEKLRNKVN